MATTTTTTTQDGGGGSRARRPVGFAALIAKGPQGAERQREIASRGGRAAQAKGTGHRYTRDEARAAGIKGRAAQRRRETGMAWAS